MIYSRGLPAEYDAWRDAGRIGWGWDDLRSLFIQSERANYAANPADHGTLGKYMNMAQTIAPPIEIMQANGITPRRKASSSVPLIS